MAPREGIESVCVTCCFAEWKRTANGRRHPDGTGNCRVEFPDAPLPKWVFEQTWSHDKQRITTVRELLNRNHGNRYIYRTDRHRIIAEPCATWTPIEAAK